jgi:hypothetical protein
MISRFLALAVLTAATIPVFAQGTYLYGLNTAGHVSVNGNKINSLPGSYDPNTPLQYPQQAWRDLAISEDNQFALRGDGLVVSNGVKLWQLSLSTNLWFWTQLQVSGGSFYELRQDGKLAVNKDIVGALPQGNFYFTSLQVVGGATYSLRSDGNVYKNSGTTPLFTFRAGNGLNGGGDGEENDTIWLTLKRDPTDLFLYALRTDGKLYAGQLLSSASGVELVDSFPFPSSSFNFVDLYLDFDFGNVVDDWIVLRANGKVYRAPNALTEAINFPGGGSGVFYVDLAVFNNQFFALRSDGKTYSQNSTNVLVKLPGSDYGRIQMSDVAPNLAGQKNIAPAVALYTIPVNTDTPVKLPVIATDVETPTKDLIVTPVSIPTDAVWDANAWVCTWTTPTNKGNYTFSYIVDDGKGSAKTYTSKVQVKLPDTDPAKNKPPYVPKISKAGALVGEEYRVYIPLNDPNGDTVTASVDTNSYPFNAGAVYNPVTSEFIWTPAYTDLGKKTAVFILSDGTTTKKLNLKIQVNSPIFVQPLPD